MDGTEDRGTPLLPLKAGRRPSFYQVHPKVLREARRRLSYFALTAIVVLVINLIVFSVLPAVTELEIGQRFGVPDLLAVVALVVSITVYLLARSTRFTPAQMLDIGLVYVVLFAMVVAVPDKFVCTDCLPLYGISHLCMLILIFPVIVPNTVPKTVVVALIAASISTRWSHDLDPFRRDVRSGSSNKSVTRWPRRTTTASSIET